ASPANPPSLARRSDAPPSAKVPDTPNETISLTIDAGTPLQVALENTVRLKQAGEPLRGRIVAPVYAFDQLVIPAGTEVAGKIIRIETISAGKRTLAAMDADFTPARKFDVEFDELILPNGKHIAIQTSVTPGSGEEMQLVTAANEKPSKGAAKDLAEQKSREAKAGAKQQWDAAMTAVKKPGKMRRLGYFALGELPVHPQYIGAGTVYFAELLKPLDFGSEPLTPEMAASLRAAPPNGSFVHAMLLQTLGSATAQKGQELEARVSQPLFDGDRLVIPQGAILHGTVIQVAPARYLSRDGKLRFVFHDLTLPGGVENKVDAILQATQAGESGRVSLDAEGGAHAHSPPARFLSTAVYTGLAFISFGGDSFGEVGPRVAGGAGGFKLIGIAVGAAVHSQQLGMAMGSFGACKAIYTNLIARGHDVVFPKNTQMQIGIGTHAPPAAVP
ncbi:MAG TPA: hypothetical protein VIC00_03500, partial [Candidatus Acidoferrales bacterium]